MVKSTERPRRAPVGRASERQRRSDLICDRKTSCPPASSPSPLPTEANLHHLRINLLHPPSSRVSRLTCFATSSFLHFVVSLVFRCSWASSRAKFISPAKYSRLRLRYRLLHLHFFFNFSPLPISFHSFACIFPSVFINRFDSFSLLFVAHSVDHMSFDVFRLTLRICSIFFLRFSSLFSSLIIFPPTY